MIERSTIPTDVFAQLLTMFANADVTVARVPRLIEADDEFYTVTARSLIGYINHLMAVNGALEEEKRKLVSTLKGRKYQMKLMRQHHDEAIELITAKMAGVDQK